MMRIIEKSFEDYVILYNNLTQKIRDSGGHVPPTIGPANFSYTSTLCESHLALAVKLYSIQTSDNIVLALIHGLDVIDKAKNQRYFGIDFLPCILIEDREAIGSVSTLKYNKVVKTLLDEYDGIYARDYCYDGALTALSSHLAIAGSQQITNFTRVINIQMDEPQIWSNIRKNYRNAIGKFEKSGKIVTYTSESIQMSHLEAIFELHKTVAGKQTRSWESWLEQFKAIQKGDAFLICAMEQNKLFGFAYFLCSSHTMFYSNSATLDHSKGASPVMIWHALKQGKKNGVKFFDIGQQYYQLSTDEFNRGKLESISFFKRGFGGVDQIFIDFHLAENNG